MDKKNERHGSGPAAPENERTNTESVSQSEALENFRQAMRAYGLEPPENIEPGKEIRFPAAGKPASNCSAFCRLFPDGMGGVFSDHTRGGEIQTWQARQPTNPDEYRSWRDNVEKAKREASEARETRHAEAAAEAQRIVESSFPASADHPYLKRKNVRAYGLLQSGDDLIIPATDGEKLTTTQRITPDGRKIFQSGGKAAGAFHVIGDPENAPVLTLGEGFGTMASVHGASGYPSVTGFNSGNLPKVAQKIRAKYPDAEIIVCADDDYQTEGNPGRTKAEAAARAVGGIVAVPDFGPDRPDGATDFNDLAAHLGIEAVREQIEAARAGHTPAPEIPDVAALLAGHGEREAVARRLNITRALTELGNSERLVDRFGVVIRYDHTRGKWRYWDGKRWTVDDTGAVRHLASLTVRSIYSEASLAGDVDERDAIIKHAKKSEAHRAIGGMLSLAQSNPEVATTSDRFDRNPDHLNVNNGIVDLKTGELLPHDPAANHSKLAPVDFIPELLERDADGMPGYVAAGPTFARFIAEITCGRRDLALYLQRVFGYAATGHANEEILFIFTGEGDNGKGVLLRIYRVVLGEYSQTATPALIVDAGKSNPGATPDIARLKGVRFLEIEETDDGDALHESRVKWLTGEDKLVGRHLYAENIEFNPEFTPVLVTNHVPRIRTAGHAMWRRLRRVPFDFTVKDDGKDRQLSEKLTREAPAVLAWIVEGAIAWYRDGMPSSETVNAATAGYRSKQDALAPFLTDCTDTGGEIHRSTLYKAYRAFCESEGEHAMSTKAFNSALRERGYQEIRDRVIGGLHLKSESTPW